jgi:hypothetical protein
MSNEDKPCPGLQQTDKVDPLVNGKVVWDGGELPEVILEDLEASVKDHKEITAQERSLHKGRIQRRKESLLKKRLP